MTNQNDLKLSYTHTHTRLTSSIHDSQHDGWDPGHLTGRGVEDDLDLLEEHGDRFGEGVGEADGDEGSHHHSPAPATLWRGIPLGPTQRWRHVGSRGRRRQRRRRNQLQLLEDNWVQRRRKSCSRCTGVKSQNLWEKQSREPVKSIQEWRANT